MVAECRSRSKYWIGDEVTLLSLCQSLHQRVVEFLSWHELGNSRQSRLTDYSSFLRQTRLYRLVRRAIPLTLLPASSSIQPATTTAILSPYQHQSSQELAAVVYIIDFRYREVVMSALQSILFCSVLWIIFLHVLRVLLKSDIYHIRKNHRIFVQQSRIVYEMLAVNDTLAAVSTL